MNEKIGSCISQSDINKFYNIRHPTNVKKGEIVLYYDKECNKNILACIKNISGFYYEIIVSIKDSIKIYDKIFYTLIKKSNNNKFQEFNNGKILGVFNIS